MEIQGNTLLLKIFTGSLDKVNGTPLYEVIVYAARKYGIAGATVTRGIMSYGAKSFVHTAKILAISDDMPIIIEMIDETEKINGFIKIIEKYFENSKYGGLVTMQKVEVLHYSKGKSSANH